MNCMNNPEYCEEFEEAMSNDKEKVSSRYSTLCLEELLMGLPIIQEGQDD